MPPSNWPDELRRAFSRTSLPDHYSERLLGELLDHFRDLKEEDLSMDEIADRLGNPDNLAAQAAAEFRSRTFAGRHPVLTFLVAPIPCAVVGIVLAIAILASAGSLDPEGALRERTGLTFASTVLATVAWSLRLLPFALFAAVFSRIAYRAGCGWRWGLGASLLLAIFAAAFNVDYRLPTAEPDSGSFMLGLTAPPGVLQWLQFAIPASIAVWLARRHAGVSPATS